MLGLFESMYQLSAADLSGLPAVALFLVLFFGTFVSEDAACIAAGALAASGEISLAFAVGSCFLGIVAGDLGLYWAGRIFGKGIARTPVGRRFVTEQSLQRASAWLNERGASAIFLSRFVTGLRLPTYLAAGLLRTSFPKFALYFAIAAAIWTPLIVGSVGFSKEILSGSVLAGAIVVFVAARIALNLGNWRNRRIAIGRLRRILSWEFWPLPVFYFPAVCYVLLLAIRYRSLTVFTCANPAIPAGGFVGEPKSQIYSLLAASEENSDFQLRYSVIRAHLSPSEKLTAATSFMAESGLSFPLVLKPNAGERGKGVTIVSSEAELERTLRRIDRDYLVQEFFDGDEASVFYYRYPGAGKGTIFSMTEKIFPCITGDGVATLETLILQDERAVCLAKKYFEENAEWLDNVPAVGERIPIIRIGTHSRGAIFRDGEHMKSAELENTIDRICRHVDGVNFGRFDIRYSSLDEFRSGRGFKIIELNGVTSESTNIYDPKYSLLDAYRILFEQWRVAFEIGAENKRLGARPSSLRELCQSSFSAIFT